MAIDLKAAMEEFALLKVQETTRNYEYYLLRQAVKGNFRWPTDWPAHIEKVTHNLCKPITERFATYLMGKGFTWNLDRPNTQEFREKAERAEKILARLFRLSNSELHFNMGARLGSQLGRTIYKVYKKGPKGAEHACFTVCQPDYFYGIRSSDNMLGDFSTVYYSYPIDILEARRMFGPGDYKTEQQMARGDFYEPTRESAANTFQAEAKRRVPVVEVWTKDDYALIVGGITKYNGPTPEYYRWKDSGEGFIPFVVIENIRNAGDGRGEADIAQARELNERLNWTISRKLYMVSRWLQPTLIWEGAPQNYAETIAATIGGGGAIPTRLGSRLYFLAYDRPNPAVAEIEATLRRAILETAGMNEVALQGDLSGSVNTGPTVEAQFIPTTSTVEKKRMEWTAGIRRLAAMLLNVQEAIGDSKALGQAVVNQTVRSRNSADGELVDLSGTDIDGLRELVIDWPNVLPKDDAAAARLEMEKASQGFQSIYTTLEKMGEEYPDDELARIARENRDPSIRGEKVAEQMRSTAPLMQALTAASRAQSEAPAEEEDPFADLDLPAAEGESDIGARMRELARAVRTRKLDDEDDELVLTGGPEAAAEY